MNLLTDILEQQHQLLIKKKESLLLDALRRFIPDANRNDFIRLANEGRIVRRLVLGSERFTYIDLDRVHFHLITFNSVQVGYNFDDDYCSSVSFEVKFNYH